MLFVDKCFRYCAINSDESRPGDADGDDKWYREVGWAKPGGVEGGRHQKFQREFGFSSQWFLITALYRNNEKWADAEEGGGSVSLYQEL